jgi:hypothetical protein
VSAPEGSRPDGGAPDPASYRDPDSAVFRLDGHILRGLSERGATDWDRFERSAAFPTLSDACLIPRTTSFRGSTPLSPRGTPWSRVIEHEPISTITYPYEWPFAMLRDAAITELEVLRTALDDGLTLKDGTIYNVQFEGTRPVFIDLGSFAPAEGPWPGYRQFCETALFPLLMHAHLGFSHLPLLRGRIDGVPAEQARTVFRGRRAWKRGVFRNVVLQAALQRRLTQSSESMKRDLAKSGANLDIAKATAKNLQKLVSRLEVSKDRSVWSDYRTTCTYTSESAAMKRAFVEQAARGGTPGRILDIGANDGEYSVLVAPHATQVVACDFDELVVDRLYRRLRAEGPANIVPLVIDLTDPSPGIGWDNRERAPWQQRMRPDLVLALALVHHLSIGANVPLPMVVDWLRHFDSRVVVEFVDADDPQSQRLLANKPPGLFADYTRKRFEELLASRFVERRRAEVPGQPRVLYDLDPRT